MQSKQEHLMTVAERLRRARIEAGLTQKQAAKLFGVSQSVISMQETGKRRVAADIAERMKERYSAVTLQRLRYSGHKLPGAEAAEVLLQLASLGGRELECVADNYIALCSYILIREIYNANPNNLDRPFRLDITSEVLLREQMTDELEKIRRFAAYSKKVRTEDIAPGELLEKRMLNVIEGCEMLVSGRNAKKKTK